MKITYNVTGPARKELVNAIAHLLAVASVYQGPPSFAYDIGGYVVDKNGNLLTPEEAETDDVFRLVDALYAEYEYTPEESLSELFPDEDAESDEADAETEEEESAPDETEDSKETDENDEAEEEAEDTDEETEAETPEEPEADDAPETAPVAADSPAPEDDTEEAEKAPENGDSAPDEGEDAAEDSNAEIAPEAVEAPEESAESEEEESSDDTKLTLSLPREKFTDAAIDRLRALVQSKQTLLKKVFETEELTIIVNDGHIMFPWFTLHGIDGETDAYAKFVHAIAMRALTSSRISSYEKPTDNDKFTMRLFLNNLGFKGEEFKFARRFLIRNLEGNGAWRYGNAPTGSAIDLDMPTVVTPKATSVETTEENEAEAEEESEETDVGNGEEESADEE